MVQISNGIWNPEAQPFEIRTKGGHFVKKPRPDLEWFGFQVVGTKSIAIAKARPFEIQSSRRPDFKWSDFRSSLYLQHFIIHTLWMDNKNIIISCIKNLKSAITFSDDLL